MEYDYNDIYMHPGDNFVDVRKFVYRYGKSEENMALNFAGLTPYETLLNFIPFDSAKAIEFQGKLCYSIGPADGKDEIFDKTLLITCSPAKVITRIDVYDREGEIKDSIALEDSTKMLTINMPSFTYVPE